MRIKRSNVLARLESLVEAHLDNDEDADDDDDAYDDIPDPPSSNTDTPSSTCTLDTPTHRAYLTHHLTHPFKRGYVSLDAAKPWIIYWLLHALDLLKPSISTVNTLKNLSGRIISTLTRCQSPDGGFGGGSGQISHLATTYAAVHALAIVGTAEAYACINRDKMLQWMLSLKNADGSFAMYNGGEVDVRGTYCVASVARLLNILSPLLAHNAGEFIAKCQSYEGGLGSVPGVEAHGGYTFCGVAAAVLLGTTHLLDMSSLACWATYRQMSVEGGFQGRTNKLVDGCYSFWVGGLFPILEAFVGNCWNDRVALQEYVIVCCQSPKGGLLDKPGKSPDFYHTCYCLSGLSIVTHSYSWDTSISDFTVVENDTHVVVIGGNENLLEATHPIHNIRIDRVASMIQAYK